MRKKEERIAKNPDYFEYYKVLNLAVRTRKYRKRMLDNLFFRTCSCYLANDFKVKLFKKGIYRDYIYDVLENGSDLYKMILVLYFEPQLLSFLFGDVNNLVRNIIGNLDVENYFGFKERLLVDISRFVTDDDVIYEIKNEIARLNEKERRDLYSNEELDTAIKVFGMDEEEFNDILDYGYRMRLKGCYDTIDCYYNDKNKIKLVKKN